MSKTRGRRSQSQRTQPANAQQTPSGQPWLSYLSLIDLGVGLLLIVTVLMVYSQVSGFEFISLDDKVYVSENAHLQAGLTAESVKWALTSEVLSNWTPVTLLSYLVDAQLFHMESGMFHLSNVLFHALAAVLLFAALRRATHARAASAFAAFMFALHPLHVGSVAWISERKDVLSACFWFLALYCYVRYSERPGWGRYLAVAGFFSLGLMSKPMLVTFPFTLLLFDFWPLKRWQWPKVLWEKVPLFALCVAGSVVTYWVQKSTGAVTPYPFALRFQNSLVSYVTYIEQTLWPTRLAIFYPFPSSFAVWHVALAAAVIVGVSALVIIARQTRPYLMVGWFWYLGTLVPVIGLIQVGGQSHADRYMYIPMIGLSIMVAWGASDAVRKWPQAKLGIAAAATACCMAWMVLASRETAYWKNCETLYQRAVDVTEGNWGIEYELALYLANKPRRRNDAIAHYEAALRIRKDYPEAQRNLGMMLLTMPGRQMEALELFKASNRLLPQPDLAPIIEGLGGGK